jgi:hypothetical protein
MLEETIEIVDVILQGIYSFDAVLHPDGIAGGFNDE